MSLSPDDQIAALERGHRARQVLSLGVGDDLQRRRLAIYKQAEAELRGGLLTPDRAFMHIACANGLGRYKDELDADITAAQRAAKQVHADDAAETGDGGDAPAEGD